MNRDWWASPTEAYIYNEFADALREGFRLGAIDEDDLLTEDDKVLAKLEAAGQPELIDRKLSTIRRFRPELVEGYVPAGHPQDPLARSPGPARGRGPMLFGMAWPLAQVRILAGRIGTTRLRRKDNPDTLGHIGGSLVACVG